MEHKSIKINISLVLPCFNEAQILPESLKSLIEYFDSLGRSYEIIVSDDGSTDDTSSLSWLHYQRSNVRYLRHDVNRGKGAALRNGFLVCHGKYIFFTDADLPIALESIEEALNILENEDCDIVIGDRRLADSVVIGVAPISNRIASKLFSLLVRAILLPNYTDTQCCLKGFNRNSLMQLLAISHIDSYSIDVELIWIGEQLGFCIHKIPVRWKDLRPSIGLFDFIREGLVQIRDLLCIRLKKI